MVYKQSKSAIVLSGGGANGAYEAGVMKALFGGKSPASGKTPLNADIFTGTSVGSFNAGMMVSKQSHNNGTSETETSCHQAVLELENIWLEELAQRPGCSDNGAFRIRAEAINPKCFVNDPTKALRELAVDSAFFASETTKRVTHFFNSQGSLPKRALELIDLSSALSTKPLQDLVTKTVDLDAILSPNAKQLVVVATNWDLGRPVAFTNKYDPMVGDRQAYDFEPITKKNGHEAILGSTAIPGVFPPSKIDGVHFVDGGVLMNTPLSPAIQAGACEIHVIYTNPKLAILPEDDLPNTFDTMNRFLFVELAAKVQRDIREAGKINTQVATARDILQILSSLTEEHSGQFKAQESAVAKTIKLAEEQAKRNHVKIHKHFPSESFGGILSLLDFNREKIERLITIGFEDALQHDCKQNECVL